jgi:hypothetical protein
MLSAEGQQTVDAWLKRGFRQRIGSEVIILCKTAKQD